MQKLTLSELVPSLDLCQRLGVVGFPQDTALVWVPADAIRDGDSPFVYYREEVESWGEEPLCAAPTAEEILKELPEEYTDSGYYLSAVLRKGFVHVGWYDWDDEYLGHNDVEIGEQSLVQAAAQAYLWWKKEVAG